MKYLTNHKNVKAFLSADADGRLKSITKFAAIGRTTGLGNDSVLGNGGINLVGPCEDAALQVENLAETRLAQEVHGFGGTLAAAAMRHDFPR